jgi:catechol 2,3-dioxygenase-like lactoylglutathione lyase family enzyme
MNQFIGAISLVIPDYDKAIDFYTNSLGFQLVEDTDLGNGKRWVLVAPPGSTEARLLLAKADSSAQIRAIGNQSGGRVFLFLNTKYFSRDHATYLQRGVQFLEAPRHEPYGTVAVFQDPFGNKWDLIESRSD